MCCQVWSMLCVCIFLWTNRNWMDWIKNAAVAVIKVWMFILYLFLFGYYINVHFFITLIYAAYASDCATQQRIEWITESITVRWCNLHKFIDKPKPNIHALRTYCSYLFLFLFCFFFFLHFSIFWPWLNSMQTMAVQSHWLRDDVVGLVSIIVNTIIQSWCMDFYI